jgi:hypothetical protein
VIEREARRKRPIKPRGAIRLRAAIEADVSATDE